jgi:D-sedoheptulose 7-phosphate isomerase
MATAPFTEYVEETRELLSRLASAEVRAVSDLIERVYRSERRMFICGNGGSAANASHFAEDFAKVMLDAGGRFSIIALTDAAPFVMAIANDEGYEHVFATQLRVHAQPGDALVCLSGSGNSANVLRATEWANAHEMRTMALTGNDGGKLRGMVQAAIHVPSNNMGVIEALHLLMIDYLAKELRHRVFGTPHGER